MEQDFSPALEPVAISGTNLTQTGMIPATGSSVLVEELVVEGAAPSWRPLRTVPYGGARFALEGLPRNRFLRLSAGGTRGIMYSAESR